eukprot:403359389
MQQHLSVDITSMYQNTLFDVLIFPRLEEGIDSRDFLCYKQVVQNQIWNKECSFTQQNQSINSSVQMLLNQQSYEVVIKNLEEDNNLDKHIVIDNTPYPPASGYIPKKSFSLMVQTRTEFQQPINLKSIIIIEQEQQQQYEEYLKSKESSLINTGESKKEFDSNEKSDDFKDKLESEEIKSPKEFDINVQQDVEDDTDESGDLFKQLGHGNDNIRHDDNQTIYNKFGIQ